MRARLRVPLSSLSAFNPSDLPVYWKGLRVDRGRRRVPRRPRGQSVHIEDCRLASIKDERRNSSVQQTKSDAASKYSCKLLTEERSRRIRVAKLSSGHRLLRVWRATLPKGQGQCEPRGSL